MVVVTMWLPFSRYISATPFSARLMASVPPEVNTTSLGSRAPISLAICSRALSTPPSASQPKGWLRLAGCPNFSVKYGIIASSTRGSTGVVDWLSMKIGSFNAMPSFSSGLMNDRQRCGRDGRLRPQLRERHAIQYVADAGLDLLHGSSQVAARELRAIVPLAHAAHHADRALERPDDLPDRDLRRVPGQQVAPLGAVVTGDQLLLREALEDLGQPLGRDVKLLRDPLRAHRAVVAVRGDEVHGHEPVVRSLRESQQPRLLLVSGCRPRALYPTRRIADPNSRSLPPVWGPVKAYLRFWWLGCDLGRSDRARARPPGTAWRPLRGGSR